MNWLVCHYETAFFLSVAILCSKTYFDTNKDTSTLFELVSAWHFFFHPFNFNLFVLYIKVYFLQAVYIWIFSPHCEKPVF
jgi:hypothetical protein